MNNAERLDRVRDRMRSGAFDAALVSLERELESAPEDPEALYMRAVCLRYSGRTDEALPTLERLHRVAPQYARGYQEAGHTLRSLGDGARALTVYRQAVALNPGLVASWKHLAELEAEYGTPELAENARLHHARLEALPPELVSVTSFFHEGKLLKAERLVRAFLQTHKHHVEAMRLLALIGARLHVLDDAEFLLESCLTFEPHNAFARFDYVNVLRQRQKYRESLEQAEKLRNFQPGNPSFETAYANALMAVGRFDEALAVYDAILAELPAHPGLHLARGHALKTVGRGDQAIAAYREAGRVKPDFGDAYWSLANLKTYRFEDDELERMRAYETDPATSLVDRYHLCFALGKAHEDRDDPEHAMGFYTRGNALKRAGLRYDPDRMEAEFERQKSICTAELLESKRGAGYASPDPIFIVGLPRAGSTLIEQILASHSQIDGTLELPDIPALAHRLGGRRKLDETPRYPARLAELDADKLTELGQAYIEDTRIHRAGAPFFVDKMPNNFRHIGLIHLILPNAKIIDARREPMACCFSAFKQLFAEGQEFSYSLDDLGRYYRGYVDLMDHWDRVLPGKVLRVQYEDVVEDLEGQVRRILDYLGLPFEDACLRFHETGRAVRTASSEQVRRPIGREGLEAWRPFEQWLGELKVALESSGSRSAIGDD